MAYARRRDENEAEIVAALQAAGCDVLRGTDIDLLCGHANRNYFLEIKQPNSRRRLRPVQVRLRDSWRGQYAIVTSAEEALKAVGLL